ncbi:MAG: hypothetical protein ACFFGZ_15185 [Candidatus Thorarchaeota archaeon]
MSVGGSELAVLVGLKKAGKKTIRAQLQKFFPQHFPEDGSNILCIDVKKRDLKSFPFKKIPKETFQAITLPVFVISYDKDTIRIQQDFFEKFDEALAEYLPNIPLLTLLHKKDQYVDPIQKKDVLEDCTRCFRRAKGRGKKILVSTSINDYSLKRAFNKVLKKRPVAQPSAAPRPPTAPAASRTTTPLPVAPVVPRAKVEPQPVIPSVTEETPPPVAPTAPEEPSRPVEPAAPGAPVSPPVSKSSRPQSPLEPEISPSKPEPFPFGGLSELGTQIKAEMKDADLSTDSLAAIKESTVQKPSKLPRMEDSYTEQIKSASKKKLSRTEFLDVLKQELETPEITSPSEFSEPVEDRAPDSEPVSAETSFPEGLEDTPNQPPLSDQNEISLAPSLNELPTTDDAQADYWDNGESLDSLDMTEIIEWSERITADEDVEDLAEFSRAVDLINFLESITTDLELDCVSLFDIGSQQEIVTTGTTSMPPEIQHAFLDAMSHAEPLSPTQIYGQVLNDPELIMAVRKITSNVVAVFIYNQTNELFRAQLKGTSEQIRTFLAT